MEHESVGVTNYNWSTRNGPQRLDKGTERVGNRRTCLDRRNYSIAKIGQNTEKNPGDLRRFAVAPISVKDYPLTLEWKCRNEFDYKKYCRQMYDSHSIIKVNFANGLNNRTPCLQWKWNFFQAVVMSLLLYGYATNTLTKCMKKNQEGHYSRMLRVVWNKFWKQQPTKQHLHGHLAPISQTIQ